MVPIHVALCGTRESNPGYRLCLLECVLILWQLEHTKSHLAISSKIDCLLKLRAAIPISKSFCSPGL